MDLADVQAAVARINPYYPGTLTWHQEGNVVKAYPRWPISEMAFNAVKKVFKRLGGKFVSHHGKAWFELVLEECGSRHLIASSSPRHSLQRIVASESSPATLGIVLTQIEAQVTQKEASS